MKTISICKWFRDKRLSAPIMQRRGWGGGRHNLMAYKDLDLLEKSLIMHKISISDSYLIPGRFIAHSLLRGIWYITFLRSTAKQKRKKKGYKLSSNTWRKSISPWSSSLPLPYPLPFFRPRPLRPCIEFAHPLIPKPSAPLSLNPLPTARLSFPLSFIASFPFLSSSHIHHGTYNVSK